MRKIKKLFAGLIASTLLFTINPISVNAEWKQSSQGWWYSEGNYYSIGWRQISGVWYYFDSNGYLKTGWVDDGKAQYYMDSNGVMKTGFQVIDGVTCKFGQNGVLIGKFIGQPTVSINGKESRTFHWQNGDIYNGEWENNVINGHGTLTYANGDKYDGNFQNGVKSGQGTFRWNNGDLYQGQWALDKMNGNGKYTFISGKIDDGTWKDNYYIG